jgi:hypothetical protein
MAKSKAAQVKTNKIPFHLRATTANTLAILAEALASAKFSKTKTFLQAVDGDRKLLDSCIEEAMDNIGKVNSVYVYQFDDADVLSDADSSFNYDDYSYVDLDKVAELKKKYKLGPNDPWTIEVNFCDGTAQFVCMPKNLLKLPAVQRLIEELKDVISAENEARDPNQEIQRKEKRRAAITKMKEELNKSNPDAQVIRDLANSL